VRRAAPATASLAVSIAATTLGIGLLRRRRHGGCRRVLLQQARPLLKAVEHKIALLVPVLVTVAGGVWCFALLCFALLCFTFGLALLCSRFSNFRSRRVIGTPKSKANARTRRNQMPQLPHLIFGCCA
jgi:hypothetical protein